MQGDEESADTGQDEESGDTGQDWSGDESDA